MEDDSRTAKKYRTRAEEVRTIAEGMLDSNSRGILLAIAQDYERMAGSLERIDATDRMIAGRGPILRD